MTEKQKDASQGYAALDEGGSLAQTAEEVLRRRAQSLSCETETEEANDLMGLLLFRLDDEWYALKVEDVREIYQEYTITSVPCVPSFILGVINIRGEIISITDIAKLMGYGAISEEIEIPPAIVVQNEECATAVVVDEIGDITDVPVDGVEPAVSTMDKAQAEFVAGSVFVDERLIGLINVERILQPVGVSG